MVTINNNENSQIKILIDQYKQKQIPEKDVKKQFISYAQKSGFINNIYRKQAWNILIKSPTYQYSSGRFDYFDYYYFI